MAGSLEGVTLKIKRAQAHLYEIEMAIHTFSGGALDSVTLEEDPETNEQFFQLRELRRPDESLGILIGDFLNNLRSALDHLAFQLVKHPVVASKEPPTPDRQIQFPICDDSEKFKAAKWRLRGAAPGVEALVETLQPYPGRTPPLASYHSRLSILRDLNDWDKHRLVHVVENQLADIGFLNPEYLSDWTLRTPGSFEAPTELARYKLRPGANPEVDVGFYLVSDVTFEDGPATGRGVTLLLAEMRYEVSQVVARLGNLVAV
jgi:hypothetical protein